MAHIHKSRARKNLAEGGLTCSWTKAGDRHSFGLGIFRESTAKTDGHFTTLQLDGQEALRTAAFIARNLSDPGERNRPARRPTVAEALRALADMIERDHAAFNVER